MTLEYIRDKYDLDLSKSPVEIPNTGRRQLAELFGELKYQYGVEIGVAHGKFSDVMVQSNPHLKKLWGIDPYVFHKGYADYTHRETFLLLKKDAHNLLDKYKNYRFVEEFSVEASKDFDDGTLDFVYIDGDHCFESVVADIAAWLPKIRKGGIISGDDYFHGKGHSKMHVMEAVQGYTKAYNIKPWFVLGRQAKIPGEIRDSGRSWLWVV